MIKGSVLAIDVPREAYPGDEISGSFKVKNVGDESGTFFFIARDTNIRLVETPNYGDFIKFTLGSQEERTFRIQGIYPSGVTAIYVMYQLLHQEGWWPTGEPKQVADDGGTVMITNKEIPWYHLTINVDKKSGSIGDRFNFYGYLKYDDTPIRNTEVRVIKSTAEVGKRIGTVYTDASGNWAYSWVADEAGTFYFSTEASVPGGIIGSGSITVSVGTVTPPPTPPQPPTPPPSPTVTAVVRAYKDGKEVTAYATVDFPAGTSWGSLPWVEGDTPLQITYDWPRGFHVHCTYQGIEKYQWVWDGAGNDGNIVFDFSVPTPPPTPQYCNLTISITGQGSTDPPAGNYPTTYMIGDTLYVTVTPSQDWRLDIMRRNGIDWTRSTPGEFLNLASTELIEVFFVEIGSPPTPPQPPTPTPTPAAKPKTLFDRFWDAITAPLKTIGLPVPPKPPSPPSLPFET